MVKSKYGPFTAKGMIRVHARLAGLYPNLGVELVDHSDGCPRLMIGSSVLDIEDLIILLKAKQIELQPIMNDINQFIPLLERK